MKYQILQLKYGDSVQEIKTIVDSLLKIKGEEVIKTIDGKQIPLTNIISFNGISFT
jgi:hypothetical protein